MLTYQFHIQGMHCKSCVILTQNQLNTLPGITQAKVSLANNLVQITGDFDQMSETELLNQINALLNPYGYSATLEKLPDQNNADFVYAGLLTAGFFLIFIILQKLGLVRIINASQVNSLSAFIIGIIASLSTCMAVVGGLVLSFSANLAKSNRPWKPQLFFHLARLLAFFILGGSIGALGAIFHVGITGNFLINFILAIILIILGINLIDIFAWTKYLPITLPQNFAKPFYWLQGLNHNLMPVLAGILTFFLPCGFTQSMQIYAISTGNFYAGAKIMLFFALGTLPVLLLLSFGINFLHTPKAKNIFFKTAGLVVMIFGIINLLNSLAVIGLIKPILIF